MAPPKTVFISTGDRFGKLTVMEEAEPYVCVNAGRLAKKWKCFCDCGNITEVRQGYLRNGKTKSCGCLRKENRKNLLKTC